jgi:hypothetical protein
MIFSFFEPLFNLAICGCKTLRWQFNAGNLTIV